MDSRAFRDACGKFATGVTVVTFTGPDNVPMGLTVNSFSSVSLDPPLVLFCLGYESSCYEAFNGTDAFAVNIMGADQRDIAMAFAKSGDTWCATATHARWDSGAPVLGGCLANLDCRIHSRHEAGDHIIVVGEVIRLGTTDDTTMPPLLYFGGRFRALSDE